MAVPKRKVSPMKRNQRRSHDALVAPAYVEDKDSGERRRPHLLGDVHRDEEHRQPPPAVPPQIGPQLDDEEERDGRERPVDLPEHLPDRHPDAVKAAFAVVGPYPSPRRQRG